MNQLMPINAKIGKYLTYNANVSSPILRYNIWIDLFISNTYG